MTSLQKSISYWDERFQQAGQGHYRIKQLYYADI